MDTGAEEPEPFEAMMQEFMANVLKSPEEVKEMMANECATEVVDSEPLLTLYHEIIVEMNSESDAPTMWGAPVAASEEPELPDSLSACRPKAGDDLAAAQCAPTCTSSCPCALMMVLMGLYASFLGRLLQRMLFVVEYARAAKLGTPVSAVHVCWMMCKLLHAQVQFF